MNRRWRAVLHPLAASRHEAVHTAAPPLISRKEQVAQVRLYGIILGVRHEGNGGSGPRRAAAAAGRARRLAGYGTEYPLRCFLLSAFPALAPSPSRRHSAAGLFSERVLPFRAHSMQVPVHKSLAIILRNYEVCRSYPAKANQTKLRYFFSLTSHTRNPTRCSRLLPPGAEKGVSESFFLVNPCPPGI